MPRMKVRVQKWGDTLALRIPESFASEMRIEQDTEVDLSIVDGKLIISSTKGWAVTLEDLLERITPENRPGEFQTGPSFGAEEW
jgi:antitoxin MazE